MGIRLVVEVLRHAPLTLTHREKLLLVALAEDARDETRRTWNSVESPNILAGAKLSRAELYAVLKRLITKGVVVRTAAGQRNGVAKYMLLPLPLQGQQIPDTEPAVQGQQNPDTDEPQGQQIPDTEPVSQCQQKPDADDSQCRDSADVSVSRTQTPTPQLLKAVSTQAADGPGFDEFYAAFPRKVGKGAARKAWAAAIKRGIDPAHILAAAQRYRDSPVRVPQYTKHPGPWLNDERYDDEPDTLPLAPAGPARPAHETNADRGIF